MHISNENGGNTSEPKNTIRFQEPGSDTVLSYKRVALEVGIFAASDKVTDNNHAPRQVTKLHVFFGKPESSQWAGFGGIVREIAEKLPDNRTDKPTHVMVFDLSEGYDAISAFVPKGTVVAFVPPEGNIHVTALRKYKTELPGEMRIKSYYVEGDPKKLEQGWLDTDYNLFCDEGRYALEGDPERPYVIGPELDIYDHIGNDIFVIDHSRCDYIVNISECGIDFDDESHS